MILVENTDRWIPEQRILDHQVLDQQEEKNGHVCS